MSTINYRDANHLLDARDGREGLRLCQHSMPSLCVYTMRCASIEIGQAQSEFINMDLDSGADLQEPAGGGSRGLLHAVGMLELTGIAGDFRLGSRVLL